MSSVPTADRSIGGKRQRHLIWLVVAVFVPLTLLFTYPIWTAPDTLLNELADVRLNTWILAWDAHALVSDPLELFDANIFFPGDNTLAFSEHLLGSAIWVAPVNWAGHPVLAYNLVFLTSFILTGIGTTLWVRHLTGSLPAGLFAGIVWTFAPAKFDHLPQIQMLTGQWIPFGLLYCGCYVETGRSRYAYATAGFAGLQFVTSVNLGMFLMPLLGVYGLLLFFALPGAESRRCPRRLGRDVAISAVILAVLVVPLSIPYIAANQEYGFERGYEEIVTFSAQTKAFLSPGWPSRTPHMRWLHETFWAPEASFFPGVLVSLLAVAALFYAVVLAARAFRTARSGDSDAGDAPKAQEPQPLRTPVRRWVGLVAAIVAAALWVFHVMGSVVAWWWNRPPAWDRVIEANQALSPALWLVFAAGLAVALLPRTAMLGRAGRRGVYLIVLGFMALLTYLLAMGPEVRAWNFNLGSGPYWFLYRWLGPYHGIRAVARFGVFWALFVAALAGFSFAALVEGRRMGLARRPSGAQPARRGAVVWAVFGVLVAVTVWEYRVWPLPNEVADPREDPAYEWLAEQGGDFAVVHVPLQPGRQPWRETRYLLGSTLHWKPLVNGYSGFFPDYYRALVGEEPLSQGFFRRLREEFPVRYVVVHPEWLSSNEQRASLAGLVAGGRNADLVAQLDTTLVFALRRDWEQGASLSRRFEAEALESMAGIRFLARVAEGSDADDVVLFAGWGDTPRRAIALGRDWEGFRFPIPEGYAGELGGRPGIFEARSVARIPLGETSAQIVSGFIIDLQDGGSGVGAGSRWYVQTDSFGFHVAVLEELGLGVRESREFSPTRDGAGEVGDYLAGLPVGSLVAVAIGFEGFEPIPGLLLEVLRSIGADPPVGTPVRKLVVLGAKGAQPGQALQTEGNKRAFIRIDADAAALEVRGISIYD